MEQQAEQLHDVHAAALEYLERGWSVFPINARTKRPLFDWGEFQQRRPTEDEIEHWFTQYPKAGLALVTGEISGLIAIDADSEGALDWCKKNGFTSPIKQIAGRGPHLFFKHPGRKVETNKQFLGVPNLDVRGDGGYVVVAPTTALSKTGRWHTYTWDLSGCDWDDLPLWPERPRLVDATALTASEVEAAFNANELPSLEGARVSHPDDYLSVWEKLEKQVARIGKLRDGDGRNEWVTAYGGHLISEGIIGEEWWAKVEAFQAEFFADVLEDREVAATFKSLIRKDQRDHPERWNDDGTLKTEEQAAPVVRKLFTFSDRETLRESVEEAKRNIIIDPWLGQKRGIQVHGYSGSGKSLLVLAQLWHAAAGMSEIGHAFECRHVPRVLYFDYENSEEILYDRIDQFGRAWGDPGENLAIWSPALAGVDSSDLNLTTAAGLKAMEDYIKNFQPNVVVIDTIRSAWPGLKENDANAWAPVNQVIMRLRMAGITTIMLHHSNKPGEDGLGREAGSTAQLKDLDLQMRVAAMYEDADVAKEKGAVHADEDMVGNLDAKMGADYYRLGMWRLSYGKTRMLSPNMQTTYLALAEHSTNGHLKVITSSSPKRRAMVLLGQGRSPVEIAQQIMVPRRVIEQWAAERRP